MQTISDTDRIVLAALATYPELSGKELAEISGISQSSFLRSRRRLTDSGMIRPVKVPSFGRIGRNIIFSGFGVVKENSGREAPGIKDIFFLASEKDKGFGIGVSQEYLDFYRLLNEFRDAYTMVDVESFGFQVFPMEMTDVWRFMDAGPLLSFELDIDIGRKDNPNEAMKGEPYDFGKGEWKVFRAMIENPGWSASVLAEHLGTSKQRIYRLDSRFREEGLYIQKMVPDLKKLGYELMMFASWKMPSKDYTKIMGMLSDRNMPWPICMMTTPLEGIMLVVFRNFRESREIADKMAEMSRRMDFEEYRPNVLFMSLPDTRYSVDFDFSGILD